MNAQPASSPPPQRAFPLTAFLIPAVVVLGVIAVVPFLRAAGGLAFPYQLDREEGFLLVQAMRLAEGRTIYPALNDYPFLVGNYPPVYPAIYAVFVKLIGPSLPAGRLINLLAALALFAALAWSVASRTRRVVPAVLAPLLFAATWDFNQWIAYARVDILALAFAVWGFVRFLDAPGRGGARGTALLFALALLTRQTMLAAPLAAMVALALRRDWKPLRALALRLAALAGGAYALLFLLTGGLAWSHLVTYNANPFHWNQVQVWVGHLWRAQKFIIVLAALAIVCLTYLEKWEGWRRDAEAAGKNARENDAEDKDAPDDSARGETSGREDTDARSETGGRNDEQHPRHGRDVSPETSSVPAPLFLSIPETLYLLLAFGAFLMVGKEGAAANYLLEFHAALALFLGVHIGRVRNLASLPVRHHALGLLNVLMFLGISFHAVFIIYMLIYKGMLFSEPPPGARERLAGTEVLEAVEGVRGEVIAEEPIYAVLTGHEVLFQPFIMSEIARQGLWDQTPFVDDLRAARFAAIVTTQDVFREDQYFIAWTPEMREAIRGAYRVAETVDQGPRWRYWVLKPAR